MGIASTDLDCIFEEFQRVGATADIEGTGLGLSISDGIVREHGGQIRVESHEDEGTEFTIELPLAENSEPDVVSGE